MFFFYFKYFIVGSTRQHVLSVLLNVNKSEAICIICIDDKWNDYCIIPTPKWDKLFMYTRGNISISGMSTFGTLPLYYFNRFDEINDIQLNVYL